MWATRPKRERMALRNAIRIDNPLGPAFLADYEEWWHSEAIPDMLPTRITSVAMDGHEKIATRCSEAPPARRGRPRKDGTVKLSNNGWFMLMDPGTGCIIGIAEMKEPENGKIALAALQRAVNQHPSINCVIYDRMCVLLAKATANEDLAGIGYWCVDKFHARGHTDSCPCSPHVHLRLKRRMKDHNSSICEQVFSWFRGYASTLNTASGEGHRFLVLVYAKRHNAAFSQTPPPTSTHTVRTGRP